MTYIEWNFVYSSANFPRTREHGAPERAPRKLEAPLIQYGAPKQLNYNEIMESKAPQVQQDYEI